MILSIHKFLLFATLYVSNVMLFHVCFDSKVCFFFYIFFCCVNCLFFNLHVSELNTFQDALIFLARSSRALFLHL